MAISSSVSQTLLPSSISQTLSWTMLPPVFCLISISTSSSSKTVTMALWLHWMRRTRNVISVKSCPHAIDALSAAEGLSRGREELISTADPVDASEKARYVLRKLRRAYLKVKTRERVGKAGGSSVMLIKQQAAH